MQTETEFFVPSPQNPAMLVHPRIARRQRIEVKVARRLIRRLLAHDPNWTICVHDGEELALCGSRSEGEILGAMFSVDMEHLIVRADSGARRIGAVLLVYGNDGYDVLTDWSVSDPDFDRIVNGVSDWAERYA